MGRGLQGGMSRSRGAGAVPGQSSAQPVLPGLPCHSCCSTVHRKEAKVVPEVNKLYMTINLSRLLRFGEKARTLRILRRAGRGVPWLRVSPGKSEENKSVLGSVSTSESLLAHPGPFPAGTARLGAGSQFPWAAWSPVLAPGAAQPSCRLRALPAGAQQLFASYNQSPFEMF